MPFMFRDFLLLSQIQSRYISIWESSIYIFVCLFYASPYSINNKVYSILFCNVPFYIVMESYSCMN